MNVYIPNTQADKDKMLKYLNLNHMDDLFQDIPPEIKLSQALNLDEPKSESELTNDIKALTAKNKGINDLTCFMGAGAYDRIIPSVIGHLASRSEFYTAYTPYQPEISQGTLQGIFEFQTMICSLMGMDVANASLYDGPSACAEAILMATRQTKRNDILISKTVHPETREVVETYAEFNNINIVEIDIKDGITDVSHLESLISANTAGVVMQSPNFFGLIENISEVSDMVHENKSLLIASVADPLSLAILESPGKLGADIAVGEGQSLGLGLQFGGPYLGLMSTTSKLMRKMPGRIVGQTVDADGKRAFVLTLQAREQHIRREKATSNICSNQGLNAMMASIYMSTMGKSGLKEAAKQSMDKAHYLQKELEKAGIESLYKGPFFDEFAVVLKKSASDVNKALLIRGYLGGYEIGKYLPDDIGVNKDNVMLLCATEKRTKDEIDSFVATLSAINDSKEVL